MSGKGGLEDNTDNLFIMQLDNFERRILILKSIRTVPGLVRESCWCWILGEIDMMTGEDLDRNGPSIRVEIRTNCKANKQKQFPFLPSIIMSPQYSVYLLDVAFSASATLDIVPFHQCQHHRLQQKILAWSHAEFPQVGALSPHHDFFSTLTFFQVIFHEERRQSLFSNISVRHLGILSRFWRPFFCYGDCQFLKRNN